MNKVNMLARVPTIIVSNSGEPVQISRSLALGVRDYIVKADLSVDEVLAKIKKCLSESSSAATVSNVRLKVLMVEEAGGRVTNLEGGALDPERPAVVASNGRIHDEMLRVLKEVQR